MLVGRVTPITGTARLDAATGKYVYQGDSRAEGRLQQIDFFVQDNWRAAAEPDAQRRRPLRDPAAVLGAEQQLLDRRPSTTSGASPVTCRAAIRATPTPETCNLFNPA